MLLFVHGDKMERFLILTAKLLLVISDFNMKTLQNWVGFAIKTDLLLSVFDVFWVCSSETIRCFMVLSILQ